MTRDQTASPSVNTSLELFGRGGDRTRRAIPCGMTTTTRGLFSPGNAVELTASSTLSGRGRGGPLVVACFAAALGMMLIARKGGTFVV